MVKFLKVRAGAGAGMARLRTAGIAFMWTREGVKGLEGRGCSRGAVEFGVFPCSVWEAQPARLWLGQRA